jgi:hypothetical protein
MLIKTIILCALLTLIVACSVVVVHAGDLDSGWPECNLGTATYYQNVCIERAEVWKGTRAPYDFAINQDEAVELYRWATSVPRPLSACTAIGVGGELPPEAWKTTCPDYVPPTITPAPTVPPTATPQATVIDDPIQYSAPWWLPIVTSCLWSDHDFQACGR